MKTRGLRPDLLTVFSAMIFPLCGTAALAQTPDPVVRTASGKLSGTSADNVSSFKGIPYAAAPTGANRWRAPQRVVPWKGVRAAGRFGPICQQKYQPKDNGVGPLPMSEDCLTLNVFAPSGAKNAPVMFWIHGGGYVNGSGTAALYDGAALARQGVVVVTINYRLGRFGFFAHPALTADAGQGDVANYGLMDMVAALKWVRNNIRQFGGDPKKVTIFGESAGGAAVNALMVSPRARGLFIRAAVQSGLGRERTLSLAEAEKAGEEFAATVGLKGASTAQLRSLSPEAILVAGEPQIFAGGGPIIDGKFLKRSSMAAFRRGEQASIPYLIGWNSLEFPVPATSLSSANPVSSAIPADLISQAKAAYADADAFNINFFSDVLFIEPGVELAKLHAATRKPVFVYQFSVVPKSAQAIFKGAVHASDREFVFNNLNASSFPTDANDAKQARTISGYWVNFAKTGNPNDNIRPAWQPFTMDRSLVMNLTNDGPKLESVPRQAAIEAISSFQNGHDLDAIAPLRTDQP